jgi:TonB family protein
VFRPWGIPATAAVAIAWTARAALAAEVVPPRRLDAARVAYPASGKGDATVVLAVVIDAVGAVTDVTVREGEAPFVAAAVAAVKAWRFAPATRDDAPIPSRILTTVTFRAPPPTPPRPAPAPGASASPASPPSAGPAAGPVEVSVRGEHEELGTNHLPRADARFVPGAFGDPFRVVEALPGMAPWLSGLPYYYVRGAPPENVGYFIDGIRVPLLFHVGVGPSSIAPPLVDTVDLFPGAYPASYGRFSGAIIAGQTTPPAADEPRGEFGARVFDANAFVETPLDAGQGTALAAGRYSYTGLLTSIIVPDYTVGYWDYQLRLSHRIADKDTVSLFVFGSHDELTYKHEPTFRVEYHRADLRYDHPLDGGHVRIAGTFSYDDTLTALQTSTGAGSSAATKGPGGRIRAEIEERLSPRALVRAGADVGVVGFSVDSYGDVVHGPHADVEGGAYADVVWRPTDRVELVPGFRFDGYRTRGETAWAPQPRGAVKIRVVPGVSLISALGVAHQEPVEEVFVPAKLPSAIDEASGENSYQFSEAIDFTLPSSLHFRVTGFYSRLIATQGSGQERAEGLELFLRRDFTQRLGGFVSYTLSRSDTLIGPQTAVSTWDRTHLLSAVLGYDLGSNWRVGARFFFESGRPYRAVCETPDCAPGASAAMYTVDGRLPAFYRLDARIEKKWEFSGRKWLAATLECFNVLDKAEPINVAYSVLQGLSTVTQSPIILPSIGVQGGF